MNVLRPWDAGELFVADGPLGRGRAALGQLRERFPEGPRPIGMVAAMEKAGGRSLRLA